MTVRDTGQARTGSLLFALIAGACIALVWAGRGDVVTTAASTLTSWIVALIRGGLGA